jgi:hypothetical protein
MYPHRYLQLYNLQMLRHIILSAAVLAVSNSVAAQRWSWTRLNPNHVEDGTHIDFNSTHLSFFQPSGINISYLLDTLAPTQPPAKRGATASGWVSSFWSWGNAYTYFSGTWTVPPKPTNSSNQIIFFFNSLEGGVGGFSGTDILQPVLQWNNGVPGWTLACWYGNAAGYTEATPVPVNVGDTITGTISLSGLTWSILGYVNGVLRSSLTVNSLTIGLGQNTAQWVLEVYNMANCNEYPPSNALTFFVSSLKDTGIAATPSWTIPTANTNACNAAGFETNTNSVTLTWAS